MVSKIHILQSDPERRGELQYTSFGSQVRIHEMHSVTLKFPDNIHRKKVNNIKNFIVKLLCVIAPSPPAIQHLELLHKDLKTSENTSSGTVFNSCDMLSWMS